MFYLKINNEERGIKMELLKQFDEVLRDYIKPQSMPIAVKLLKDGNVNIPPKAKQPSEFLGYPIALCQGFSFARKYGWTIVFKINDIACGPALSYFGFIERPEFEKEGGIVYPNYAKTLEAGKKSEDIIDKLSVGEINSIVIAPLSKTTFEPDIIMIYCNAAQIARLTSGALYCEGGGIETVIAGRCACSSEIITPLQRQTYNVIVPDGGERMFGLTGDDEMVFSVPYNKVPYIIEGIVTTHKSGVSRYPYPVYGLRMEPKFPDSYEKLVEIAKGTVSERIV
mgnify:CR=1 FL=1